MPLAVFGDITPSHIPGTGALKRMLGDFRIISSNTGGDMTRLLFNEKLFEEYEYASEAEFERDIVNHANQVFGEYSLFFDVKRRMGIDNIVTIPDGYLIDFFF